MMDLKSITDYDKILRELFSQKGVGRRAVGAKCLHSIIQSKLASVHKRIDTALYIELETELYYQ